MKVKFTVRRQVSYNGYSVNTYDVGEVYEAKHGAEEGFFKQVIHEKHAEPVAEAKSPETEALPDDHPAQKTQRKVQTPKRQK